MSEAQLNKQVSFSPLKHHFNYQLEFIEGKKADQEPITEAELITIGNNLTDVYNGLLSPVEICSEVATIIALYGITDGEQFHNWIGSNEYRIISLSDESEWVVRESEHKERFIHLHPAKKSLNTFRIKGTTLKTVLMICILDPDLSFMTGSGLSVVNKVRKEILGLSPVKSLDRNSAIVKWKGIYDSGRLLHNF